ncbi:Hypothetical predicted protein, partial [Marmota monax]
GEFVDWDCWLGCGFCAENPLHGSRHLLSVCCLDGSVYIVRQLHLEVGAGLRAEPCPLKAGPPVCRCTFGQSLLWGRSVSPCEGTCAPEEGGLRAAAAAAWAPGAGHQAAAQLRSRTSAAPLSVAPGKR